MITYFVKIKMKKVEFETEVKEYLKLKSKATRNVYASTYRKFLKYYQNKYGEGTGFSHFLDRIYDELKKPQREQGRLIEDELGEFINYLKAEGKSNNTIRLHLASVQNFLKYKHITVSTNFIGNVPPAVSNKKNGKHEWKIGQIKKFVEKATNYRDKAIILCMFQSGLAVNEICQLNYEDIQDDFENGVLPICLKLVRKKTGVEFKTFFGHDAVKYLRLYLSTRKDLKFDSPLFTKKRMRGGMIRITTAAIQYSFNEIAKGLSFIKQNGGYNPARPHSLRAGFNSQLIGKIDETLRDFWMGHTIGGVSRAYLNMPTDELRKLYMTAEEYLKIEKTSRDEMDEKSSQVKLTPEVEEKIKTFSSKMEKEMKLAFNSDIDELKEQLKSATELIYSFEPVLNTFSAIADTKEGQELILKIKEAKLKQETVEAQKEDEEITKEHPLSKE